MTLHNAKPVYIVTRSTSVQELDAAVLHIDNEFLGLQRAGGSPCEPQAQP